MIRYSWSTSRPFLAVAVHGQYYWMYCIRTSFSPAVQYHQSVSIPSRPNPYEHGAGPVKRAATDSLSRFLPSHLTRLKPVPPFLDDAAM
ncbi:hypothetical protein CEP53_013506 [Fusarium sp. AF-6]|nr:hypothetical protein CEP53_013506 [Fusarium sp. AF-6]